MLAVVWLVGAVLLALLAHRWVPPLLSVPAMVGAGLLTGAVHLEPAGRAIRELAAPLGFLVAAVPLAVLLDHIGFFDALATRFGDGPRLLPGLWCLAAVVTTVLNLDASIVLLTPLYIRIAQRSERDPYRLAFIPVLLATLASSALPVSNLTNLIVAEQTSTGVGDFLAHLGPASLLAVLVGWWAFRRLPEGSPAVVESTAAPTAVDERRAMRTGTPAVLVLLLGFTIGDAVGIPAWAVAGAVALALMAATRAVPWRSLPLEAVVVAAGLAVLASAASAHLALDRVVGMPGVSGDVRTAASAIIGANAVNNLPALLVGLPHLDDRSVWPFLAGVNFGPVLWVYGSLAGLLWMNIVRSHGLRMTPATYARTGWRVGLPALAVAMPATVLMAALLG